MGGGRAGRSHRNNRYIYYFYGRSPPFPNCLKNRTCKKFKSASYVIISIIICACVSCYCKNQISAREISSKTSVRRREMAFPSSRNPKFSRESMSPDPLRWSWHRHLMFTPHTFTFGYAPGCHLPLTSST